MLIPVSEFCFLLFQKNNIIIIHDDYKKEISMKESAFRNEFKMSHHLILLMRFVRVKASEKY